MSTENTFEAIPFPIFVRKLDRQGHWFCGEEHDPEDVVAKCFRGSLDELYSLYVCKDMDALAVIMGGLHLSRGLSSVDKIDFIYFTKSELEAVGAKFHSNLGSTPCKCCNSLHVDIEASSESLLSLCDSTRYRSPHRYSKSNLSTTIESLQGDGCSAFGEQALVVCKRTLVPSN
jgi:hypothetical protein